MNVEGVFVPVVTPFNDDESVDEARFGVAIDYMIDGGVTGIVVGCIAGTGFGFAFVLLALTNDAAGLAPVPIQRLSGLLFLTLMSPLIKAPWISTRPPGRNYAVATGLAAGLAMGLLQLGYRHGEAGPVSVAASQFAAATVLISAIVNGERLRWWQGLGLGLASLGVALMAVG